MKQQGGALLVVMLYIFLTTLAAVPMVNFAQTELQREKEEQLLFVGDQYRKAISSYYNTVPAGSARILPKSFDDLLNDQRFSTPIHHLRKVYPDPINGSQNWGLMLRQGRIYGVYSLSNAEPFKVNGFPLLYKSFEGGRSYSDWRFSIK